MDNDLLLEKPPGATETNRLREVTSPSAIVDETREFEELKVEAPERPKHITLDPPVDFDGQPYHELTFDFDALNGKEFQRAERTFTRLYKPERDEVVIPETKHLFQSILAAQVADVPLGLIVKLPRRYYVVVRRQTLKACGSSLDEDKE